MTMIIASVSGLLGVLVGYWLARPQVKPIYFDLIANTRPPTSLSSTHRITGDEPA